MAEVERPKWEVNAAMRAGIKIGALAVVHRALLDKRVAPAVIDGLVADSEKLREANTGTLGTRTEKEGATVTQDDAAKLGGALAMAIREAAKKALPKDKSLHKLLGVGKKVDTGKVSSVEAALKQIENADKKKPAKVRLAGVLPDDIVKVKAYRASLSTADTEQEGLKVTSKMSTADRNALQLEIEAAIGKIIGAVGLAFFGKKSIIEQFTSLIPKKGASAEEVVTPPTGGEGGK